MTRYVAFLRGMNVGGHRITNDALCASFEEFGFEDVWAFLASGNVAFEADGAASRVKKRIETGLQEALGYAVPTFLRTGDEVAAIADATPFDDVRGARGGKLQVAILDAKPSAAVRTQVLARATDEDQLAIGGRELYWLPTGGLTESALDSKAIESVLGGMTVRTHGTIQRLAKKLG